MGLVVVRSVDSMGATLFVQPFDLLKNRMQLAGRNSAVKISFAETAASVIRKEGFFHLYDGYRHNRPLS
jgi:hypothetical protein